MTWNSLPDGSEPSFAIEDAPAPLFRDPIFDGAADPSITWNTDEDAWWVLYTQRRADVAVSGNGWIHGRDVGVAFRRPRLPVTRTNRISARPDPGAGERTPKQ